MNKSQHYVVFDTETTGLLKPKGTAIKFQPYLVEIYVAVLNSKFEQIKEFESLVKPPVPIPDYVTKIHGITDEQVANAPYFYEIYPGLFQVFSGCKVMVAANLSFDKGVLDNELRRIKKLHSFPYSPALFCTIEQSLHLKGYRLKNSELYKIATRKELVGAHRAKADVMATIENLKWLKSK